MAGGLPAGVSITPLGGFNPGDEPNEVVKEFKVTLPQNQDIDFDLNFTAVSEETSNGDQEVVSKAIAIEVDYNQNFFNATFFADDQDIRGPGDPFSFHEQEFIGIDDVFDPPQIDIPIPPTPLLLFGDAKIDAQVGFDFEVKITGGEFDATIPIDVQVDTVYNKTTDQFLVNPTFDISDLGAKIDGTELGRFLSILPIFDVTADFEAGLDFVVTELEFVSFMSGSIPTCPISESPSTRVLPRSPFPSSLGSRSASTFPNSTRMPDPRLRIRWSPTTPATTSSRSIWTSTSLRQTTSPDRCAFGGDPLLRRDSLGRGGVGKRRALRC